MTKNYIANDKDFHAINEALSFVWHPKMHFVFKDSSKIKDTIVLSYDSKSLYLWSNKIIRDLTQIKSETAKAQRYNIYKIPHKIKIRNEWQHAWCAGVWDKHIENYLPEEIKSQNRFAIPIISGGLLGAFLTLQKKSRKTLRWPYTTRGSYLATIIHEFAHVYWNQHKLWWPSNTKRNIKYLKTAIGLYKNKKQSGAKIQISFPTPSWFGELFAYCTEYWTSQIFWPNHKKLLDEFAEDRIEHLIREESKKDLNRQDSVIEPSKYSHDFSLVLGKIILSNLPESWPLLLTNPQKLS